jgi:hypothetical protein
VLQPDSPHRFLRHTVATLAYRAARPLRDAPGGFAAFRAKDGSRSAGEILAHMGDLIDWAVSLADGAERWRDSPPQEWPQDAERFFTALQTFDARLASGVCACSPERLVQGPIVDALTHVGQLALLRRLAGAPIKGENYFKADITAGRAGADQPAPRREF